MGSESPSSDYETRLRGFGRLTDCLVHAYPAPFAVAGSHFKVSFGNALGVADAVRSETVEMTTKPTGEFLQYGGQAVIEGVMMRSPHYFAVACRTPEGAIVTQCEEVDKSLLRKLKWLNKPFLRGTLALSQTP